MWGRATISPSPCLASKVTNDGVGASASLWERGNTLAVLQGLAGTDGATPCASPDNGLRGWTVLVRTAKASSVRAFWQVDFLRDDAGVAVLLALSGLDADTALAALGNAFSRTPSI